MNIGLIMFFAAFGLLFLFPILIYLSVRYDENRSEEEMRKRGYRK